MKRLISLMLSAIMLLSLLPMAVWAEDGSERTESDEGISLTVDGQTVYFYNGIEWGYMVYGREISTGNIGDDGTIPAFFVYSVESGDKFWLGVDYEGDDAREDSAVVPMITAEVDWLTATRKTDIEEKQKAIYEVTTSKAATDGDTASFTLGDSTFAIVFEDSDSGDSGDSSGGDGNGSNIVSADESNGDTLVITEVQDVSDRDNVELDVDWQENLGGRIKNIGLTAEVLAQIDEIGKTVFVANWCGVQLFLPRDVIADMAGKVSGDNRLWIVTDYCNDDGGSAVCFRVKLYIGETVDTASAYTLPTDESYTFGIDVKQIDDTYEVYCPTADYQTLEKQTGVTVTAMNYSDSDMMRLTFAADHDGMFLLQPENYVLLTDWPWYGLVSWTPSMGTTPTNASEYLRVLYDAGYTFPTIGVGEGTGVDFHLTFPEELKEWTEECGDDWDYKVEIDKDAGRIDVIMNYGDPARWEAAARSALNDSFLADGIYYRYYFGDSDGDNPMPYGMDGFYQADSPEVWNNWLKMELYDGYYPNNGWHMAALNKQDAATSMMVIDKEDAWQVVAMAMDEEEGKTAGTASVKFALELHVTATATTWEKVSATAGTVIKDESRITVDTSWSYTFTADGTIFMGSDGFDPDNHWGEQIGEMTVTAPTGYTLEKWESFGSSYGDSDTGFPVLLRNLYDQRIDLYWKNNDGDTLQEMVLVEYGYADSWVERLASEDVKVYKPDSIMDDATKTELEKNGISVTYYGDIGYFVTEVDATKVKDISVLEAGVELTVPDELKETARYWKIGGFGGSDSPTTWGQAKADAAIDSFLHQLEATSVEDGVAWLPFINLACIDVVGTGLQVYYAASQMYDSCVVQWLAEDQETILGYSYVYGRNGDFGTEVETSVKSSVEAAVTVPTLVSDTEDIVFTCDQFPQSGSGDGKSVYLRLEVEGASGEQVVYLPYSYFDMTVEQGLALAEKGEHPTIYHYLDDSCTDYEEITGEYTKYSVKFTTTGFSPFVLDCSLWGDLNGTSTRDASDMQALYEYLTQGEEKLPKAGAAACDLNKDGSVDVYDLQYLYEVLAGLTPKA